jgi:hypothetical protein
MLLTNNVSIKEVILFPSMKKLQEEGYGDIKNPGPDQERT